MSGQSYYRVPPRNPFANERERLWGSSNLHSACRIIYKVSWKGCVICFYTSTFQVPLNPIFHALNTSFNMKPSILFLLVNDLYYFFPVIYCSAQKQSEINSQASGNIFCQTNCHPFPHARFLKFHIVFKQLQFFNNISQLGANMEAAFLNSLSTTLVWDNCKNRCDSFVIF